MSLEESTIIVLLLIISSREKGIIAVIFNEMNFLL